MKSKSHFFLPRTRFERMTIVFACTAKTRLTISPVPSLRRPGESPCLLIRRQPNLESAKLCESIKALVVLLGCGKLFSLLRANHAFEPSERKQPRSRRWRNLGCLPRTRFERMTYCLGGNCSVIAFIWVKGATQILIEGRPIDE